MSGQSCYEACAVQAILVFRYLTAGRTHVRRARHRGPHRARGGARIEPGIGARIEARIEARGGGL